MSTTTTLRRLRELAGRLSGHKWDSVEAYSEESNEWCALGPPHECVEEDDYEVMEASAADDAAYIAAASPDLIAAMARVCEAARRLRRSNNKDEELRALMLLTEASTALDALCAAHDEGDGR